ncbi:MAG: FAD-dependent tricarballylate dehydrogenase TcuA [Chloroflexota bacterium]|nr:FAD-dependent tricarballylate dehydrogenase TcuA [Chloroflexota bacterium]MDE3193654.1 FAD-dependent tricarballylate dehydrogenase TcuA [Chloroflexota bacterium]
MSAPAGADVVVVGGGNAALCAALTARESGASVILLERSSEWDRGGNSKHTRNIRCARDGTSAATRYGAEEFLGDLRSVTGDALDSELARYLIAQSREVGEWMEAQGVRWQPALRGTLQLDRTNRFFLGGGKALVNTYYARAAATGVTVSYEQRVERFVFDGERVTSVVASLPDGTRREIPCRAVVVASGGFEANIEWLRRYWGSAVDNYRIRGTPHNDGNVLQTLLEAGAETRGTERGFHAIAVDARAPRFDGGIVTRVDSIPFGIVVNSQGERFYDEGEEIWPKRYATWGGLIARQPDQLACSIFDSKAWGGFIPCMHTPYRADTVKELAEMLHLPAAPVVATVERFNAAAHDHGTYDMAQRDGRSTRDLPLPKSNWALTLDTPPFYAYPLRPGITFTYLGVGIDGYGHVRRGNGCVFPNLFAAGEVMSGNILLKGYLAGIGMTIGTVFGRLAGREAARAARA